MSYYYFISTLPSLIFGESPPLSSSDFIDDAKKWVSNSDWQGLNAALSGYDACIKLPAYKIRGKVLVKKSEFEKWIDRHRMDKKKDINGIVDEVVGSLKRA